MIKLKDELLGLASWVLSIIGPGGSGKTTTAFYILDKWFPDDEIAIFRYPAKALAALPPNLRKRAFSFSSMQEIMDRPGIRLLDDTALHFLSRSTSDKRNKDMVQNMTIARHNDHRYVLSIQNTMLMDKGLMESLDQFTLRCKMSYSQAMTEREYFIPLQLAVNDLLEDVGKSMDPLKRKGLRYCAETDEILRFPDWEHMNEAISKPYRGCYIADGELTDTRA